MKAECPLRRVSCSPVMSHPTRLYTNTPSARPTPCVPFTAIVCALRVVTVISRLRACARCAPLHEPPFCSSRRLRLRTKHFLFFTTFSFNSPFSVPVLAFDFGLATWVQPSHSASPCSSSVPGANLVLARGLFFLPLSLAVCQTWGHGRWYKRSG